VSCCEKCWADAYIRMRETGRSQGECYRELLEERKDNPCTPEEQAGQWEPRGQEKSS
jgi:hypothetical protein